MDIGSVLIALALALAVAAYLVRPFLERRGQTVTEEDHEVSMLLAERDRILSSLQDLEMDRTMGKILEEDYEIQRQALVQKGAGILRRLDDLRVSDDAAGDRGSATSLEEEIEAEIESLRRTRGDVERRFCPSCGRSVEPEDRFCTHCGEPLTEELPT